MTQTKMARHDARSQAMPSADALPHSMLVSLCWHARGLTALSLAACPQDEAGRLLQGPSLTQSVAPVSSSSTARLGASTPTQDALALSRATLSCHPGSASAPARLLHGEPVPPWLLTPLQRYFAGVPDALLSLPIDPAGTPFQLRVWRALRTIPSGETRTYRALAETIAQPTASRAVGQANGRNPIALVLPCHRVVRASGDIGGYAYGQELKRRLLLHEHAVAA